MFEFFATATQTSLTTLKDNRNLLIKVEAAAGIVCVVPCADGICEFPAGVYTVCDWWWHGIGQDVTMVLST